MIHDDGRPVIANVPGVIWRKRHYGWEARWVCRTDLIEREYPIKSYKIWGGEFPTELDAAMIQQQSQSLQREMLSWAAGLRAPIAYPFDGTLRGLISAYQTDKDSTYHALRFGVRKNHDTLLKRVISRHGSELLTEIKARTVIGWHKDWSHDGKKLAMGHAVVTMLRTLFSFGLTILENDECERLSTVMSKLRFASSKPRTERMTADQAVAVRIAAHEKGWHSIALAQALQFDLMLRQKDVIGEWIPLKEKGLSTVTHGGKKWLHGLQWSEIDDHMILSHVTSKRGKTLIVNLSLAPMVLEELAFIGERPVSGPMLICEHDGRPWGTNEFRRKWRIVADAAGLPKAVKNMDSRAGAITEASDAGADLEMIRHAATHSNISMTQRYSRGAAGKIEVVMQQRADHRNKKRTETP